VVERRRGPVGGPVTGREPLHDESRANGVGRGVALGTAEPRSAEPRCAPYGPPSPTRKRFQPPSYSHARAGCSGAERILHLASRAPMGKSAPTSIGVAAARGHLPGDRGRLQHAFSSPPESHRPASRGDHGHRRTTSAGAQSRSAGRDADPRRQAGAQWRHQPALSNAVFVSFARSAARA